MKSNYRLEQYMKESHHHIARLPSFSIMEQIILSKVKCTNIPEVKPSDWQQAKGIFSAAFIRESGHVETSTRCAFPLIPKMLNCYCMGCWVLDVLEI